MEYIVLWVIAGINVIHIILQSILIAGLHHHEDRLEELEKGKRNETK